MANGSATHPTVLSGRTRILPIIGHPVAGVVSIEGVNRWLTERHIDAVMIGIDIPPDTLDAFWQLLRNSLNMAGCSVTYPHKLDAFHAVDRHTGRAARLGALNTVRRDADGALSGEATDGLAMCAAIAAAGVSLAGKTVRVLGAGGGAGRAIVDALCEHGIASLSIEEIDARRRHDVLELVDRHWPDVRHADDGDAADILVNATTLGLSAVEPLPFTPEAIAEAECVADVVGGAEPTRLVRAARQAGRRVVDGRAMGKNQIASQMAFLFPGCSG